MSAREVVVVGMILLPVGAIIFSDDDVIRWVRTCDRAGENASMDVAKKAAAARNGMNRTMVGRVVIIIAPDGGMKMKMKAKKKKVKK